MEKGGGQFPFSVSTNAGGTLELCARRGDGFDSNAYLHFQALSNQLASPSLLVCPEDRQRSTAAEFRSLQPGNVSYRLRSGVSLNTPDKTNAAEALAVCPVHGCLLRCGRDVDVPEARKPPPSLAGKVVNFWRYDGEFRHQANHVLALMAASCLLVSVGTWLKLKGRKRERAIK